MSVWHLALGVLAYALAFTAVEIAATFRPLHPLRWLRRYEIAQHLCDRVEFWGMGPIDAWNRYEREVGGLWGLGDWRRVHDALWAAHGRHLQREWYGFGLDAVSDIPARLVLSDPQHTTRAA